MSEGIQRSGEHFPRGRTIRRPDVAVLMAAHNEDAIITEAINSIARLISRQHIYIISDGSSDHTGSLAKQAGVNVLMLRHNRGKAGALVAGIRRFQLTKRYKAVLFLDADTRLDDNYFRSGLPMFRPEGVVAVAGNAKTLNDAATHSWIGRYLLAYRQRVYVIFQLLVKYGQAARRMNAVAIVPGFASMYRTEVLDSIDIDAPGFVIEDYNMTFQVHAKKLGSIAFQPDCAIAYTQDPNTISDYIHQTRRWTLGFWQAVNRHQFRHSVFAWAVSFHATEIILSNIFFVIGVTFLVVAFSNSALHLGLTLPASFPNLYLVLAAIMIQDYVMTIIAAIKLRRPIYLILGLGFVYMRFVELAVNVIVLSHFLLRRRSSGRWKSPTRRSVSPQAVSPESST